MTLAGINLEPTNVLEALASLEAAAERLRAAGDPRAIFPDVYAIITAQVAAQIHPHSGFFLEPAFISRLSGRFAQRYLETLEASLSGRPQDCTAWSVAYAYARRDGTLPLQHAALAISAHINFDLAHGLHATLRELGITHDAPALARYKRDHDAVNHLLATSMPLAIRRLARRYGCRATRHLRGRHLLPWASRRMLSTLQHWRETVWSDMVGLLEASGGATREQIRQRMERRSRRIGYHLSKMSALNLVLRILHPLDPLYGTPEAALEGMHRPRSSVADGLR